MDALISPEGSLEILSRSEVAQLRNSGEGGLYELWRQCSLAVLNAGSESDDVRGILREYRNFDIAIVQQERGMELKIVNAPESAFVDGRMIRGIREQLYSVVRDLLYTHDEILASEIFDLSSSDGITNAVFHILRNARAFRADEMPKLVVCWGGHAISREEYDYSKAVGYELGLRKLDICTGCGAGAMKGPMKGAALGHAKQRIRNGRYLGITEPTIIAAESPNPIVNELVIMPDMEKRLEAFVRLAHALVVFPGGAGTAEEVLYVLGILLNPDNSGMELPLVFTGPKDSERYFRKLDEFIGATLGKDAQRRYEIVLDDPPGVASAINRGLERVRHDREEKDDAYFFNWLLAIDREFQHTFTATHDSMAALNLHRDQPLHWLAVNLRRAFSGIVAGNVRESGIRLVDEHGPFELRGEPALIALLGDLLEDFVAQRRMRLSDPDHYVPCYRVVQ
ncbi:MAG TPA: nucleotide 5'-monophosphate nucleosidase PpnN [Gammaproteobacteria bacterium]